MQVGLDGPGDSSIALLRINFKKYYITKIIRVVKYMSPHHIYCNMHGCLMMQHAWMLHLIQIIPVKMRQVIINQADK